MAYIKKDWVGSRNPLEADPGSTPITEEALDHLETQYDEAVAYTDEAIEGVVAQVDEIAEGVSDIASVVNTGRLSEEALNDTFVGRWGIPVSAADPRFGGLVYDGDLDTRQGTDNADALRAAIAHAKATGQRAVYIPGRGTLSVTKTIPLPSQMRIYSDGPTSCRIVCPTPGIPVFASENWLTGMSDAIGGRATLDGILVRAEALDPGSHGIVLRDYHSTIRNCVAQQCGGDGFRADAANQAGVNVNFTLVENYYETLFAEQNRGWGFRQNTSNGTQLTDAHMMNVVVRGLAQASNPEAAEAQGGISIPHSAGWQVSKIHTYGRFREDGVVFGNLWGGSILDGAHIESGYEGVGLRIPNFQRGGIVDNIIVAHSEYGKRVMVEATKHSSLYPGEPLVIGSIHLVSTHALPGTGVSWNTQTADLLISRLTLKGENVGQITLFGGFGAQNIKTVMNARVLSEVRDSASGRTLTVGGTPLAVGHAANWGGGGAKALTLTLPPMTPGSARQFMLSIGSSVNYTSGKRATYVASVMVGLAVSGSANAYLTDLAPPVGFDAPPTVAVTTAPTASTTGALTVSFTPTHADGYGSVGLTGGQA